MSDYQKFVAAAQLGDQATLAQAAALATEVTAGSRGQTVQAARQAAIEAGIVVRSVRTYQTWREIAQWAGFGTADGGEWVEGLSFRAHHEAKDAGISIEELRATPTAVADIKAAEIAAKEARLAEVTAKYAAKAAELKLANETRLANEKAARQALVAAQEARLAKIDGVQGVDEVPVPVRVYSAQPVSAIGEWADGIDAARVTPIRQAPAPVVEPAESDSATPITAGFRSVTGVFFYEHAGDDAQLRKFAANLHEIMEWVDAQIAAKVS